ncbi:MAG: DAK2 domain-containing protein [Chitinivibrionales bacterium]|nr:DAK2 domain-containing protein [Chitinivibrionales bacterium]
MTKPISIEHAKGAIRCICASLVDQREELNRIDGQMGDGDIGITVAHGCARILEALDTMEDDFGTLLLACAQQVIKSRASSFGTLVATGIMAMAKTGMGKTEITAGELAEMLAAATDKMAMRGKSAIGDKTVLDAIDAVRAAIAACDDSSNLTVAADRAAAQALERFQGKPCKQGRARIFAERSATLDDPGMVVVQRITHALVGVEQAVTRD